MEDASYFQKDEYRETVIIKFASTIVNNVISAAKIRSISTHLHNIQEDNLLLQNIREELSDEDLEGELKDKFPDILPRDIPSTISSRTTSLSSFFNPEDLPEWDHANTVEFAKVFVDRLWTQAIGEAGKSREVKCIVLEF